MIEELIGLQLISKAQPDLAEQLLLSITANGIDEEEVTITSEPFGLMLSNTNVHITFGKASSTLNLSISNVLLSNSVKLQELKSGIRHNVNTNPNLIFRFILSIKVSESVVLKAIRSLNDIIVKSII